MGNCFSKQHWDNMTEMYKRSASLKKPFIDIGYTPSNATDDGSITGLGLIGDVILIEALIDNGSSSDFSGGNGDFGGDG